MKIVWVHTLYIDCLEHKLANACYPSIPWQKGITDILVICQLYPFGLDGQHVLTFVLQAIDYDKIPL